MTYSTSLQLNVSQEALTVRELFSFEDSFDFNELYEAPALPVTERDLRDAAIPTFASDFLTREGRLIRGFIKCDDPDFESGLAEYRDLDKLPLSPDRKFVLSAMDQFKGPMVIQPAYYGKRADIAIQKDPNNKKRFAHAAKKKVWALLCAGSDPSKPEQILQEIGPENYPSRMIVNDIVRRYAGELCRKLGKKYPFPVDCLTGDIEKKRFWQRLARKIGDEDGFVTIDCGTVNDFRRQQQVSLLNNFHYLSPHTTFFVSLDNTVIKSEKTEARLNAAYDNLPSRHFVLMATEHNYFSRGIPYNPANSEVGILVIKAGKENTLILVIVKNPERSCKYGDGIDKASHDTFLKMFDEANLQFLFRMPYADDSEVDFGVCALRCDPTRRPLVRQPSPRG